MALVSLELLGLIVEQPLNVIKLAHEPALDAVVIREPRPLEVRLEQDRFWGQFA